jgi:hypothetical protein
MNTKIIGLWSYLIGIVLAMATVFVDLGDWATQALIVLGILVGFFHHDSDDIIPLGLIYLVLVTAAETMGELVAIGSYVSDLAMAWVNFLGPVVLITFLIWGTPLLLVRKKV